MIMICQWRFILGKNVTLLEWYILVSDVDNGGGYACVGIGVYGKSLYLPLNFVVNLKLLLRSLFIYLFG